MARTRIDCHHGHPLIVGKVLLRATRVVVFDKVLEDPHQPNAYGATITYDLPAGDRKQDEKDDQLIN